MAIFSYNEGALAVEIAPKLEDINGISLMPLLSRTLKLSKSSTSINWNADLGGQAATGELVTAAGTTDSTAGAIVPAALAIGISRFRHTFSVSTIKLAEAAAIGEGEVANQLALAGKNAMRIITRSLAANIYTGTGNAASGGVVGLGALHSTVASAKSTSVYAGIDPDDHANWSNYVNTAGTNRALTTELMFKMSEEILGGATVGSNQNYTAIYTTPAICTKYKSLFAASSDLNSQPNGLADVGYSGLSFEGRPIYLDPYAPANTLYFVDDAALALYSYVENENAYGDEQPMDGIVFKIVQMSRTNPDAVQFAVVAKNQLTVLNRPGVAVLSAIVQ